MGNYSKGANGTISSKFGSVVGNNWLGIDYLKRALQKEQQTGIGFTACSGGVTPPLKHINMSLENDGMLTNLVTS